ncbi:MAG: CDP-diacylglycerol--glycerol-3-phosphate 3-phosphatidyltransferase (EC [uncultured Sulfurovum sp.]|uniref:CDP-diacylglycerol--glycerol-3-phosphate 3-phosphatidyltransferase (EC) n=1 Tax=uncultured Sulfurovum sp. TaxID=269237 RepID=A0A6S6SQ32_9BACT|nr:MAG: CDP-diacylglycerol--glycerol-3-phosphate 3-phosphatidyltransferase (EC [uncultured Sulfurovum sp.]
MTIYDLKPRFQALLRPTVKFLANKNITPNQVTMFAMLLSLVVGLIIAFTQGAKWILLFVPLFMFLRMALNAIDGLLAKEHDLKTKRGAMFNEMSDVISDVALFLPFALIVGINPIYVVLFTVVGVFNEMAGVVAQTLNGERRYDGPMGKSDRVFVLGFISLLLGLGVEAGLWVDGLFIVATLLAVVSTYNRAMRGSR